MQSGTRLRNQVLAMRGSQQQTTLAAHTSFCQIPTAVSVSAGNAAAQRKSVASRRGDRSALCTVKRWQDDEDIMISLGIFSSTGVHLFN